MTGKVNPFMEVYKKRRYKTGQKALTPVQVQMLFDCIADLVHLGLFQLAVVSGIRREDIVRIRVADVNFDRNSVTFHESKKNRTHTIYIPKTVTNTLKMITNINKREPYLFPGNSEKIRGRGHLTGRTAYNIFHRYLAKTDLRMRPFHALRATCIKMCQHKGWTMEQTAEHVGDTIRVIQEHYTTPSEEEMVKVATEDKPIL